jgi:uncharacterized protein
MNRTCTAVGALILAIGLFGSVVAEPYEDGLAAFMRGDHVTAMRIFRPLAEQGDAKAQVALGDLFNNGLGVKQDYAEAVRWYRKAAEQGNHWGQNNLAIMYEEGRGVPQDYVQAHMWFNLSAAQYSDSEKEVRDTVITHRNSVAAKMTPAQIAEAQKLAREWKLQK